MTLPGPFRPSWGDHLRWIPWPHPLRASEANGRPKVAHRWAMGMPMGFNQLMFQHVSICFNTMRLKKNILYMILLVVAAVIVLFICRCCHQHHQTLIIIIIMNHQVSMVYTPSSSRSTWCPPPHSSPPIKTCASLLAGLRGATTAKAGQRCQQGKPSLHGFSLNFQHVKQHVEPTLCPKKHVSECWSTWRNTQFCFVKSTILKVRFQGQSCPARWRLGLQTEPQGGWNRNGSRGHGCQVPWMSRVWLWKWKLIWQKLLGEGSSS